VVAGVRTFAGNPLVGADDGEIGEMVIGETAWGFCCCWTELGVWASAGEMSPRARPPSDKMLAAMKVVFVRRLMALSYFIRRT
jgi:hypothetical protein